MSLIELPIDSHLDGICQAVTKNNCVALSATPGSGKTTRVPSRLMDCEWATNSQVVVLEPRRIAAKLAAHRVASEKGQQLGCDVGYRIRGDSIGTGRTRLWYLTEGVLIKSLLGNKTLAGICCVVLDEFHERSIHTDFALAALRKLQCTSRPDLKIVLMSATMDQKTLGMNAPEFKFIEVSGQVHPLEIIWAGNDERSKDQRESRIEPSEIWGVIKASLGWSKVANILVFLPGFAEISKLKEYIEQASSQLSVLVLHSNLTKEEQDKVLFCSSKENIILSTNIAESSVTLPNVNVVIDSGLHRQMEFNGWNDVPTLKTKKISQASAIQRAGRAARVGEGRCYRIYTKYDYDGRLAFDQPEIVRTNLNQLSLELAALGWDYQELKWPTMPPLPAIHQSQTTLKALGLLSGGPEGARAAVTGDSAAITALGLQMVELPISLRLGLSMYWGMQLGIAREVGAICLQIENGGSIERLLKLAGQFSKQDSKISLSSMEDKIAYAFLGGFADLVARVEEKSGDYFVKMASGEKHKLTKESAEKVLNKSGCYFVIVQSRVVRRATHQQFELERAFEISEEWLLELNSHLLDEKKSCEWDVGREKVVYVEALMYGQIELDRVIKSAADHPMAAKVLFEEGLKIKKPEDLMAGLSRALNAEQMAEFESELKRHLWVAKNLEIQTYYSKLQPGSNGILELVKEMALGCLSLEDLKKINWAQQFKEALVNFWSGDLEKMAPCRLQGLGRKGLLVHYEIDKPVWVEGRIQDFFGLNETPKIWNGKVSLAVHLLAPNGRPVQITSDLSSFWKNVYPKLRIELRRRYPRHDWPEIEGF